MSRRVSLPGADELFRSTGPAAVPAAPEAAPAVQPVPATTVEPVDPPYAEPADAGLGSGERDEAVAAPVRRRPRPAGERRPSGRERHEEKITVYCSAEELLDLERTRLALRGEHGLVADRGRIVREALAVVLADFDAKGEQSVLVRRLRNR